nr:hypothetical protein CFP56_38255 [Quercus suber]
MINGLVFSDPLNEPWLISFVYGPPNSNNRGSFWEAVEKVGGAFGGGWLRIGDFNHVFSQADKKGGKPVASSSSGGPNELNLKMEKKMIECKGFGSKAQDVKHNKCMAAPARGSIKRKIFNGIFDRLKITAQRIARMLVFNHEEP